MQSLISLMKMKKCQDILLSIYTCQHSGYSTKKGDGKVQILARKTQDSVIVFDNHMQHQVVSVKVFFIFLPL